MSDLPEPLPPEAKPKPRRGRPRKLRSERGPLPELNIDFKRAPADQIIPCSELEQSQDLGWSIDDVRVVNQSHGLYTKLPMICKGEQCFWAKQCPTAPDFLFVGVACPLQVIEAYSRFVELVQELEVKPDDNVDLDMIADLVRIDLRMKEIDMQIAVEGQMTEVPITIWQKTGEVKTGRGVHPLLAEQRQLRKDRNALYDKLIASRDAKKKAEALEGKKEADLLQLFAKAFEKGQRLLQDQGQIIDVTPLALPAGAPEDPSVDAPEGPPAEEEEDLF